MTDLALLPEHDADVPAFWQSLDLPGLLDVHVHFLPKPIMDRAGPSASVTNMVEPGVCPREARPGGQTRRHRTRALVEAGDRSYRG